MPWKASDADRFKKGLTPEQKKKWAKIANSALSSCMSEGGTDCEARAIRIANSQVGKKGKEQEGTLNMEKETYKAHLVKTKDLILEHSGMFDDISEGSLDSKKFVVKNCMIASTRESQNGYTYTDRAFNTLTDLAEGARVFLDHPSAKQAKDTGGVRPIRDFAGVFRNVKRNEDKVSGDLYCRESVFPLFKDIARLQPEGVGMSINSRVRVFVDDEGKESVVDIDRLNSVDMVSSASLTKSLFESVDADKLEETAETEEKELEERVKQLLDKDVACECMLDLIKRASYSHSEMNQVINEGVIADKMKEDEIRMQTNELIWKASDMVYSIIHDDEISMQEKKDKVTEILDDLDSEISKRIKKIKSEKKEQENKVTIKLPTVVIPDKN